MDDSATPPTGSNPTLSPSVSDSVPVTVTNATPGQTPNGLAALDKVIAVAGQFNIAIPIAFEVARAIIGIFRDRDPAVPLPTDAEVIAHLRARALEDKTANEAWLREKGYL